MSAAARAANAPGPGDPFLAGRRAVVTGAGRGIGAAVARALAAAGAEVVAAARGTDEIEAVAAGIESDGGTARAVPCDVTDPDRVAALAAAAGPADVLVNNAGTAFAARLESTTLAAWESLFAVNVRGVFLCTKAFLPAMLERGWGRVVNVASVAGLTGAEYISAYAATKHAVVGFTRSVAAEVADRGVTVNAVCPGYVDTDLTRATIERIVERTGRSPAEAEEAVLATSRQGRLLEAAEVARAVTWLCEEASRGVNGQAIAIDGGGRGS